MRITRWVEYGIICSLYLGRNHKGHPVSASDISKDEAIPLQYTHQILQRLRKGGVISSSRGPKGGYRLSKDPEKITLRDVITAVEGDTFEVICNYSPVYPNPRCTGTAACCLKEVWRHLKEVIDRELDSKTLKDILTEEEKENKKASGAACSTTASLN